MNSPRVEHGAARLGIHSATRQRSDPRLQRVYDEGQVEVEEGHAFPREPGPAEGDAGSIKRVMSRPIYVQALSEPLGPKFAISLIALEAEI